MAFDIPSEVQAEAIEAGKTCIHPSELGYPQTAISEAEMKAQQMRWEQEEATRRAAHLLERDQQVRASALEAALRLPFHGDTQAVVRAARDFYAFLTESKDATRR